MQVSKRQSRSSVSQFYEARLKTSGKDNGKPGARPDRGSDYYAAFFYDPDGNNVEAATRSR